MPKLTLYKHSILFYPERFMYLILWKWIKLQDNQVSLLHIRITRENYRTLMPGPRPSPVRTEFLELETWYQNWKDLSGDSNVQTRLRTSGSGCCHKCIVLIHFSSCGFFLQSPAYMPHELLRLPQFTLLSPFSEPLGHLCHSFCS